LRIAVPAGADFRTGLPHKPEVALGLGYVFEDLRLESFGRGPLDFAAQAEQKLKLDRRLGV